MDSESTTCCGSAFQSLTTCQLKNNFLTSSLGLCLQIFMLCPRQPCSLAWWDVIIVVLIYRFQLKLSQTLLIVRCETNSLKNQRTHHGYLTDCPKYATAFTVLPRFPDGFFGYATVCLSQNSLLYSSDQTSSLSLSPSHCALRWRWASTLLILS